MNNNNQKPKSIRVNVKDLRFGDPIHHIFTKKILDDIDEIKEIFKEVSPKSSVEWIYGFACDMHPEIEIGLWLYMGKIYTRAIQDFPDEIRYKNDIFKIVLKCSMEDDDYIIKNVKSDILSEDEVRAIIALYRG